jgi:uroporphyrinogen decarboxylase
VAITQRERLNRTLSFQDVDRPPFMEIALWEQTVERWKGEGLPEPAASADLLAGSEHFGLEGYDSALFNLTFPEPCPPEWMIREDERHATFVDGMGRTRMALKSGTVRGMRLSMDCYIDFPVKTRDDWKRVERQYAANREARVPEDWSEAAARLRRSARPTTFFDRYFATFGYYSMLRNWMGTVGLSYMLYDDPALVTECLEFLTDLLVGFLEAPLRDVGFDLYYIHEDMAGSHGPLVSPETFRTLFLPSYRRFVGFLKSCGVRNVIVDTDGCFAPLIPVFLDAGVQGFGPIERAAGMDPQELRSRYGKSFSMIGGIDKRVLRKERAVMEAEIMSLVPPLIEQGGYIPTIDHSIPPDVSLREFETYLAVKRRAVFGSP